MNRLYLKVLLVNKFEIPVWHEDFNIRYTQIDPSKFSIFRWEICEEYKPENTGFVRHFEIKMNNIPGSISEIKKELRKIYNIYVIPGENVLKKICHHRAKRIKKINEIISKIKK